MSASGNSPDIWRYEVDGSNECVRKEQMLSEDGFVKLKRSTQIRICATGRNQRCKEWEDARKKNE